MGEQRKLVQFEKSVSDNYSFVKIRTISRAKELLMYRGKSNWFYFTFEEIDKMMNEGSIIAKDGYSYCRAILPFDSNLISFELTWLESNGHDIKGRVEYIKVDRKLFTEWYNSENDGTDLKMLNVIDTKKTKIIFCQHSRIKQVIDNPIIRKKFAKHISHFQNGIQDEVRIYDDFVDYSFYFEKFTNGRRDYNGGIILHKDYDNPKDLKKARYGTHT